MSGHLPSILLIEDDDDHAELFCAHLADTSFARAPFLRVTTLGEGRAVLARGGIDLAFVDLTLPDSGIDETLDALAQLAAHRPVVVVTAFDDRHTLLDIIGHGADDCLPKCSLSDTALERTIRFNLDRWRFKQQAIAAEREKYSNLLVEIQRVGKVGFWERNLADGQLRLSDEMYRILEVAHAGAPLSLDDYLARVHPDDREGLDRAYRQSLMRQQPYVLTYRLLLDGSRVKYLLEEGKLRCDVHGRPSVAIGTVLDITQTREAEQQLLLAASVFSHASEGILITRPDGTILDVNEAFIRMTGYCREELIGANPRLLKSGRQDSEFYRNMWQQLADTGRWSGEIWNRKKSGEIYPQILQINAVQDAGGGLQHYVALFIDITALKDYQRQLEQIAHYDSLTRLPNRVLLADLLKRAMAQTDRRRQHLVVVFLDLDGFKEINDGHGHDVGDEVLVAVSARLKQALRDSDTIARIGGDEFVAVLMDFEDHSEYTRLLDRMREAAAMPIKVGERELRLSVSMGVTFFPQAEPIDADQLLRQADQAMYRAKQAGKNCYRVFDAEAARQVRSRLEQVERIREGLAAGEFELHYQPRVDMRAGRVVGVEALIRWQHPERGLCLPASFLPVIGNGEMAVALDDWVIRAALAQQKRWLRDGLTLNISVNVTPYNLQQHDFVDRLKAIVQEAGSVDLQGFELEVLETSAINDLAHVSGVIEACGQLGIRCALDDFGTGYSSLSHLRRLPASTLKIDRSFVRDMLDDLEDYAILEGILGLAEAFGRDVIAEGVESAEQGVMLLLMGCDLAQGFGIARPMAAGDVARWVRQWQPETSWQGCGRLDHDDLPLLRAVVGCRVWMRQVQRSLETGEPMPALALKCAGVGARVAALARRPGLASTAGDVIALQRDIEGQLSALVPEAPLPMVMHDRELCVSSLLARCDAFRAALMRLVRASC